MGGSKPESLLLARDLSGLDFCVAQHKLLNLSVPHCPYFKEELES